MGRRIVTLLISLVVIVVGCNRVDGAKEVLDKARALKTEVQRKAEGVTEKARRDSAQLPSTDQSKEGE
jgi:hypothetical protein